MSKAKYITAEELAELFKLADDGKTPMEIQAAMSRKLAMPTIYMKLKARKVAQEAAA